MNNVPGVMKFSIGIIALIVIVTIIYIILEKRKKKNITRQFRKFSEIYKVNQKNSRAVPRVRVPRSLEVVLTLTDNEYHGLKARAVDLSLSGFSVSPDFPLRKLPMKAVLKNVVVNTPINTFVIKEMKTVRIDHQIEMRLMAFHIEDVDEDQFENLQQFMVYLDEFLRKKDEKETA
jgi:c-di-GMP-binding flagellar brake protein YcgR